MLQQIIIIITLILVLVLFVWGRWRYDLVALLALLVATLTGVVPEAQVFSGFGHPAVITVAAVLIASRGLLNSGMVDFAVRFMTRVGSDATVQLTILLAAVTLFSAFMNNIGALALIMPVAIRMARKNEHSSSLFLMPLAFASLLGGLITQVGTPPNIIISLFRAELNELQPFRMFDFAPVGAGVALAGILFIVLIGRHLLPQRQSSLSREELFEIKNYITVLEVPESCKFIAKKLEDIENAIDEGVVVIGYEHEGQKIPAPEPHMLLHAGDRVIIRTSAEAIQELLDITSLKLEGSEKIGEADLRSEEIGLMEVIVTNNSVLHNRTARSLNMRARYGINLLGVSREGGRLRATPDRIQIRAGDVLLLQGHINRLQEELPALGCLPLAERNLKLGQPRRALLCMVIFAVALAIAALSFLPAQIAFVAAAAAMVLTGFITLKEVYESIDWPIIILLGAMLPVSQALETTGVARLIAGGIISITGQVAPWVILTIVLVVTMLLSNVVNNAAAAMLMAPIAVGVAAGTGASLDPFLMSVAIGSSCAFLTPVGHQSNLLVMGPGGYHFGDYWRMGLPLSIIVTLVAIPLIMLVWPPGL